MYDKVTGVSTYRVCYTSKASANQRAGRAGRTGPGHCYRYLYQYTILESLKDLISLLDIIYRLYSSAVFNDQFEQFSQSEIQRKPVDDLLLQMKVMNIDKVVNFPFPTPPDTVQLQIAEKRLMILGALQQQTSGKEGINNYNYLSQTTNLIIIGYLFFTISIFYLGSYSAKVTPLGRSIAAFPVAPRYGKMLALSHQYDLLQYTVCMVAALSVQEVLMETLNMDGDSRNKLLQMRRFWAGTGNSLLLGNYYRI